MADEAGNPKVLATYSGTAVKPGVSLNGRLYSRELIARMVARAQERLEDPEGLPLTALTHHAAEDDSTLIVGRLTSLTLDRSGACRYTAEMADTPAARKILALIEPDDGGKQFLRGVSIRGYWLGQVRREAYQGQTVETADDLELDGLDFTRSPGVPGASVDSVQRATSSEPAESVGRSPIHESADALVLVETSDEQEYVMPSTPSTAEPAERVSFADNGYRDGTKRFPLNTAQETVQAWHAFTQTAVASAYSPAQLKRARQRIGKALESHGFRLDGKHLTSDVRPLSESAVTEWFDCDGDGSFCVTLTNGPVQVTVSSWYVDPKDLPELGKAAMEGAVNALMGIDPDLDGDVDVPGASAEDDPDGDAPKESTTPAGAVSESDTPAPEAPAADPVAGSPEDKAVTTPAADPEDEKEEPAVSEPTTPAAGNPAAVTLSADQFAALLSRVGAPAAAPEAPVESAPAAAAAVAETEDQRIERIVAERLAAANAPVQETEDQRIERLVGERVTSAVQGLVESGGLGKRKGLVRQVATESVDAGTGANSLPSGWPDKPLHEYTPEEWAQFVQPTTLATFLPGRGE